ncbi:MAG: hypothetical protein LUH82_01915 [Clostridiales bacterium]|nr:hypothetical protein [Clostridiales bacterium]
MANSIDLAKIYVPLLDEAYKEASLTVDLDASADLVKAGYNANEIVIPILDMDGLGDYSRNDGYVSGDATLTWETVKCDYDRGRKFQVDDLDDIETGGVAFGKLSGEFIRTKVVPELDAYRFASYASTDGVSLEAQDITTGQDAIDAIAAAMSQMDDDEVPAEGRLLYITPLLLRLIGQLDTTKSREVLGDFYKITKVPQSRFYTAIDMLDGSSDGQTAGGFQKGETATNINFAIIHPSAVIQANKIVKPKILSPDVNPDGDAWVFGYRLVSHAETYQNKVAGIYVNHATA